MQLIPPKLISDCNQRTLGPSISTLQNTNSAAPSHEVVMMLTHCLRLVALLAFIMNLATGGIFKTLLQVLAQGWCGCITVCT